MSVNYTIFSINKQLLFTQKTFEKVFNFLNNDFNEKEREAILRITVVTLLKLVTSTMNKIIDQLNNEQIFAAIQRLKRSLKNI